MSAKCLDIQGRWRNKTVAFRVSPEEDELLETAVRLSGLTKQDYIIRRLQEKEVVVTGNPRVYKALKNELAKVLNELKRLKKGDDVPEDLLEVIRLITVTHEGRIEKAFKCRQTPKGRDLVEYSPKTFYEYSIKISTSFQRENKEERWKRTE